jgi:hypothetical protein
MTDLFGIPWRKGLTMGHRQWYLDMQPDDSGSLDSCQTAAAVIQGYPGGASMYEACETAIKEETPDECLVAEKHMRRGCTVFELPDNFIGGE